MCRLGNVQLDDRSPQDMIEEFVASHSLVAPWSGPANDMRKVVEEHPIGPVSDYYILPDFMRVRSSAQRPPPPCEVLRAPTVEVHDEASLLSSHLSWQAQEEPGAAHFTVAFVGEGRRSTSCIESCPVGQCDRWLEGRLCVPRDL